MTQSKTYGNCKRCGRYAPLEYQKMCPECLREDVEKLNQATRYLQQAPNAAMEQIADALDVELDWVEEWVRSGRLRLHHHHKLMNLFL